MTLTKKMIYATALMALTCYNVNAAENKTHLLENIKQETTTNADGKPVYVFSNVEFCQLKNSRMLLDSDLRRYERHFIDNGGTNESVSNKTCYKVKQEYKPLTKNEVREIMETKFL